MILLNGKLQGPKGVLISPLGEGFQFGAGVFTTLRVSTRRMEFFAEHAERLAHDAAAVGLERPVSAEILKERCEACIAANRIVHGGLKIVWFADESGHTTEIISQRAHSYGAEARARGFRLVTMPCGARELRELSRHKTLNYLEHAQARRAAVAAGGDDALWVDERGRVLEGATSNVFAVFRDEIVTPDVRLGLLPGVARRVVMRLAVSRPVRAGELTEERLREAEEVFVTNSLMGIMPVIAAAGRTWDLEKADITREIGAAWNRACDVRE